MDLFPLTLITPMPDTFIRAFRPNVTRDQALALFAASGPASLYWKLRGGPLQRIADVYVPFRLYHVRYPQGGVQHSRFFAIDAVDGSLDLFQFAAPPVDSDTIAVTTRNHPATLLSEDRSLQLLREKVLRLIFQQGFFKLRRVKLETEPLPGLLHLPYWLGFYGTSNRLRCRALDAVRRRIEGAKASALFEQWLAA